MRTNIAKILEPFGYANQFRRNLTLRREVLETVVERVAFSIAVFANEFQQPTEQNSVGIGVDVANLQSSLMRPLNDVGCGGPQSLGAFGVNLG